MNSRYLLELETSLVGPVTADSGGRALCLSTDRPFSISGPGWLELCVLCSWWKPNLIGSSLGCLSQVCRPALSSGSPTHYMVAAQWLICPRYSLKNGELLVFTGQPSLLFLSVCVHIQPAFLVALKKVQVLSASSFHEKISGYCDL